MVIFCQFTKPFGKPFESLNMGIFILPLGDFSFNKQM